MTEAGLAESGARIRAAVVAWGSRTVEARLGLLTRWASQWASPLKTFPADVKEVAEGCGLSPQSVAWGLSTTCLAIQRGLRDLIARSVSPPEQLDSWVEGHQLRARPFALTAQVWASTVPTSGWVPVIASLAIGSGAVIKAPAAVRPAADLLRRSLLAQDPIFGSLLEVHTWEGGTATDAQLVETCDAVVVSGGRDAVQRYSTLTAGVTPLVAFGPGESLAVIPASAECGETLMSALALDVSAYDQLGCLSPVAVWVEDAEHHGPALAAALAAALGELAVSMPRGVVPAGAAAEIVQRRGTASFLGQAFDAPGALVCWEPTPYTSSCPRFRTVALHSYSGGEDGLVARIKDWAPRDWRLHCAGVAGPMSLRARYADALSPLGVSRVCSPGTMQAPPASWHHDGMRWLSRLVRYVDLG